MSDTRIIRERMGLRVIRILTNMLMLTGSAAALGIFTGASEASLASVCLFMAAVAVAADRIQHRIRSFPVYTAACLGIAILTAVLGRAIMAEVWIPLTVVSLAEIRALYGGRVSQKPAFAPQPFCLLLPVLIWMVGTFGEIPMLRAPARPHAAYRTDGGAEDSDGRCAADSAGPYGAVRKRGQRGHLTPEVK